MSGVTPIRRCEACGVCSKSTELPFNGITIVSCSTCREMVQRNMDQIVPVYASMLECGVPVEAARESMIYLLACLA